MNFILIHYLKSWPLTFILLSFRASNQNLGIIILHCLFTVFVTIIITLIIVNYFQNSQNHFVINFNNFAINYFIRNYYCFIKMAIAYYSIQMEITYYFIRMVIACYFIRMVIAYYSINY